MLRFDDTNPTAEKQEYIDSIKATLKWLNFIPWKITYSSDYFQELYDFAVELIKRDKAYVCHQTQAQVKASREIVQAFHGARQGIAYAEKRKDPLPPGAESPYRYRPVEESLRLFEEMRQGRWKEGTAALRMKMDLYSDRPSMWDTHAYRIMFATHPHSGDKWCIYPTYDYTHCIVDSLENITHSLCTLEFGGRQAPDGSYYWLLDALGLYKPMTWESSRLNITGNVMSKRKLNRLVTDKFVSGWDDPRLFTLDGLKRRGYTSESVNGFCKMVGVTKNQSTTPCTLLERCVRMDLDRRAKRVYAVVEPLRIRLMNFEGEPKKLTVPFHPGKPSMGSREMMFGPLLYIERTDFREVDASDYYGLAPGKTVKLLYAYVIRCDKVVKDKTGNLVELQCTYFETPPAREKKQKIGYLHWVCDADCVDAEIRVYNPLFTVDDPISEAVAAIKRESKTGGDEVNEDEVDVGDRWLSYLNSDSLVVRHGKVEAALAREAYAEGTFQSYQFQRRGFFCVDKDSTTSKLVFNRTCTLKESVATKAAKSN